MSDPTFDPAFLSVMARMGARPDLHDPTVGSIRVVPNLSANGIVLASPLMLLADTVVGMRLEGEIPEWTFTTDFSIRRPASATGEIVSASSRILRHGRRLLVEELEYTDEHGAWVATAQITFMRTPLRPGEQKPDIAGIRERMGGAPSPTLDLHVNELAGVVVSDPTIGEVVLEPHDAVRRPGGFVQGAIITLLGEMSALAMAEHTYGHPCVATGLDARYLIGGRTGPLVTAARWLGEPADGTIAVELIDRGHDDVVSTTFVVHVEPIALDDLARGNDKGA